MGLAIKDREVVRLVRELAALTGETQATALRVSVEERLARLTDRKSRVPKMLEIGRGCSRRLRAKGLVNDHDRFLYGPEGTPK